MTSVDRRRFLQVAAATAAASALPSAIARAAAVPAAVDSGTLDDVEHIVVLMQENRSFDHYFGTLGGVRGFGDPRPVTLPSGKPVWYQADSGGKVTLPFRPNPPEGDDLGLTFIEDLNHDWNGTHKAWASGRWDTWVPAKSTTTMAHLTRQDIPFHYALADAFTVCDAYHCSLLSSTDPNRYYLYTGWVGNDGSGGGPVIGNEEAGYGWQTFPEVLQTVRSDSPWPYTVGAGKSVSDSWQLPSGASDPYQFSVFGPGGWLREWAGTIGGLGPEVTARDDAANGQVTLVFTGGGSRTVTFTATDAYAPDDHYTYTVAPGRSQVVPHWGVPTGNRWYDVTVTCDADPSYVRRFAGHVENGAPSTSDPATATG